MNVAFDNLPARARVWIYQASRPLTEEEMIALLPHLAAFAEEWTSHGQQLVAAAQVLHRQFLVIGLDEAMAGASGCSIDASVRFVQELEQTLGVGLLEKSRMAFLENGELRLLTRSELRAAIAAGQVGSDTLYFNNTLTTKAELDAHWLRASRPKLAGRLFCKAGLRAGINAPAQTVVLLLVNPRNLLFFGCMALPISSSSLRKYVLIGAAGPVLALGGCASSGKLSKADNRFLRGEYEAAIPLYQAEAAKKTGLAAALANFRIGEAYRLSNRVGQAEPFYKTALDGKARTADLSYRYAESLRANGKLDEAAALFTTYAQQRYQPRPGRPRRGGSPQHAGQQGAAGHKHPPTTVAALDAVNSPSSDFRLARMPATGELVVCLGPRRQALPRQRRALHVAVRAANLTTRRP
ncbi:MAG: tetratricopeptide repeat protein [Hymenobacter sp.]